MRRYVTQEHYFCSTQILNPDGARTAIVTYSIMSHLPPIVLNKMAFSIRHLSE